MRKLRVDVAATDAAGFFFAGPPPASRIAFVFRASAIERDKLRRPGR
jgi:hypothetical protein